MAVPKINVKQIITISYIVLSALFILLVAFNYLKVGVYNAGYQNGAQTAQIQTLQALITESNKGGCQQPLTVNAGPNNSIQLIDVKCSQQPAAQQPAPTEESTQ